MTAGLNQPFDLMGTSMGAPVAVAWTAEHPDTVRRLVLYGGWARGAEVSPPAARDHVLGLVGAHWGLGSDVLTDIFAPDADRSMRAELAPYQRACSTAATARALLALSYELDVSDRLSQVRAPTLVVHRTGDRAAPNADIAARLGIGERSAEGHVERIRLRLGFRSRAQIAAWYSEWRGSTVG